MGQPPPTAHRARTTVAQSIRHDVERIDRQRPERSNPVRLHRQEELRQLLAAALTTLTTPRSAPGSTASTPGAPTPTSRTAPPGHHNRDLVAAILAFLHTGLTNARTEGYNRLVKQVKRVACGFRNTENSRRRIRFHCTRTQRANTRFTTVHLPA